MDASWQRSWRRLLASVAVVSATGACEDVLGLSHATLEPSTEDAHTGAPDADEDAHTGAPDADTVDTAHAADAANVADTSAAAECEDASTTPIRYIQNNAVNAGGGVATGTVTLSPLHAGDLLVVEVDFDDPDVGLLGATDTEGNAFHQAFGPYSSTNGLAFLLYAENVSASAFPDVVTVTLTDPTQYFLEIYILEYSGIQSTDAFDVASANSGGSKQLVSEAQGTHSPHELIVGVGLAQGAGAPVVGPGFTSRSTFDDNQIEDMVVSCIGSYEATENQKNNNDWTMVMGTFRGH